MLLIFFFFQIWLKHHCAGSSPRRRPEFFVHCFFTPSAYLISLHVC